MSRSVWVPSGLAYRSSVVGGDAGGGVAGDLGALGGVFGQVAATARSVTVPVPVRVMTRMSISVPQVMIQPPGWAGCGPGSVADGGGGLADGIVEVGDGEAGRRGQDLVRVGGVVAVEAEQGVEVDCAAGLVFGGLAVRDADRVDRAVSAVAAGDPDRGDAPAAGELAEAAFDGLLGAPPQFAGGVVPHHVGGVVVAVRAQRLAEPGVVAAVPGEAGAGRPCGQVAASRRAWQGCGPGTCSGTGRRRCAGGPGGRGPGRRTGR